MKVALRVVKRGVAVHWEADLSRERKATFQISNSRATLRVSQVRQSQGIATIAESQREKQIAKGRGLKG